MEKAEKRNSGNEWQSLNSVVLIGNYLPRRCGIATFTMDLSDAIAGNNPGMDCWVVAMNDRPSGYAYPQKVQFEINQNQLGEYEMAAEFINMNNADVVCLQHEYGIFGGKKGSFILELLRGLKMPVVTTLHTILKEPSPQEHEIIVKLAELSDRMAAMSSGSVELLRNVYDVPQEKIVLIPHLIPDVPFTDSKIYKEKFSLDGKKVILTFGLLSPSKGIEYMIDAMPDIVKAHPETVYMVIGATHPNIKASRGEEYRLSLHLRARELGVEDNVAFYDRFVEIGELMEFIGAADIYVTPYPNEAQIVSGTLSYALGAGKAVVSTPYLHAQEMLDDGRGVFVPFRDSRALSKEIIGFLDNPEKRLAIQKRAYAYCRNMIASEVGRRYLETFISAKNNRLRELVSTFAIRTLSAKKQRLPEINLGHMRNMTDDTGILQHARFTVPRREEGYCTDDNARALIAAVKANELFPEDVSLYSLVTGYLGFLRYAYNDNGGRFRNFMSYDRKWLEEVGSEDSHGRAIWALGSVVAFGRGKGHIGVAMNLFQDSLGVLKEFTSPRAIAFSLIGIHEYLRHYSGDTGIRRMREILANRLLDMFRKNASEQWPWPENILTYDNARIPHALMLSGEWMQNGEMFEWGMKSLKWLRKVSVDASGRFFSPIGNAGWYSKGGEKAVFDQQPLEAPAMIDACIEAFYCTQDEEWISYAFKCFNWFLGENELRMPLYDHGTGGCRDGLEPNGVNENEGAESTLSWLLSLLSLYGYQGGITLGKEEPLKRDS